MFHNALYNIYARISHEGSAIPMRRMSFNEQKKANGGDSKGSGVVVRYYYNFLFWSIPVYGPQYNG